MIDASGETNAPILVCGEAPGREELRQGIPFVGPTGRIFWTVAREAGISRSLCYVTNVVQSAPLGASGAPSQAQIREEWARLDEELRSSEARIVVVVGGVALKRITGLTNITNMRGYCLTPDDCRPVRQAVRVQIGEYKTTKAGKYQKGDPRFAMKQMALPPVLPPRVEWIIPVLHPAGIMRTQFKTLPALKADLLRVGRLYRGESTPLAVDTIPEGLGGGRERAIDIETPRPPNDWLVERIGVADAVGAHTTGDPGGVVNLQEDLQDLAKQEDQTFILHNSAFDLPRLDIWFPRAKVFDTMYAAQLLNPDLPKGLERAATMLLDVRPWKHMDEDRPDAYNKMDAWVTYHLAQKQRAILERTGQMGVFENMMRGIPVLSRITERGIKLDREAAAAWTKDLESKLDGAMERWPAPDVNPASPKQVQAYLYEDLGLPRQATKDGKTTTDDAALNFLLRDPRTFALCERAAEAKAALNALRDIRDASKALAVYASVESGPDGRVHPQYLTTDKDEAGANFTQKGQGAGSGRIQARDPNIMNQSDAARLLYVPSYETWCMAYIDWSSAEARVEAALSGDEALMEAIAQDLHEVIRKALGVDRTRAKNIYYGTGRGAGPRTLARTMNMAGFPTTEQECEAQQRRLFALFGKWSAWRNKVVAEGRAKGYITNPFGRRRYFYHSSAAPAMIGFIPQSTVADMLWSILPAVSDCLLTPVHDAVLIEGTATAIGGITQQIQAIMEREWPQIAPGFVVPTTAKIGEPGQSWGALEAA